MKIISVHEGIVPISSSIRNAWIDFSKMDCSIVAVVSDVMRDGEPVVGYGFNSNGRYSAGEILRRRVIPRLLDAAPDALLDAEGELDPTRAWDFMMSNEKPGGHGERSVAVGVVDMALFDLASKIAEKPLYRWLSDKHGDGQPDDSVFVYAAGGYYAPGKTLADLQDEMRGFLDQGYNVVKMKIGGADLAEDLERIEAVLEVLGGDGQRLAVDVNGKFDLATALEYGAAIEQYNLFWYEEVGDPLDYRLNAVLSENYSGRIATGENLFSLQDARNLVRYAGMRPDRDIIQVDPALSYGLTEYLRIQKMLKDHGWSSRQCIPHGGHQFSLHIAAALKLGGNESYPGEFQPTGGFADGAVVENSRVGLTETPGIGFEGKAAFYKVLRELH
ncbi:mandelate racemase/muconate lactonizing enzyme family protein [Rhodococcus sp. IEGM 1401]|uniref:mandelate racemase/muconate lactonizing enzyme family protein n=1 Tax=unclassified Rhodococcus (in: high G+C Gram-positive bacteria) TaxID=192944 RepID=UPI0022B55792|nr:MULTISPECIES: mandelate racemase/muconate lactonizing enzyme family protein [unclassified Rhodococcus (in: high G+C Gram-positive bacteria)]MCZ4562881.1 mandelate racemase/muconate lactonizing enzyme family protein [Rhodococcus sp. IEGM 1401]MDI9923004.1 mandelate racemase/muconate lactonizing enzyme family protein [Rhodococcus sp. IEGM 1372]MDV8035524.1 mandelate racemase/muconate lactonizing enzyme family protein [Rhodococcus sp. IEGM 1414]